MKKAVIFNYGRLNNKFLISRELNDADYIICADGGANFAYELGIVPHFLIGDLDSVNNTILSYFKHKNVTIIEYPAEKDFTDTELCIDKAIQLGCDTVCILGGVGGRIDHTLANINLLHYMSNKEIEGYFVTDEFNIYLLKERIQLKGKKGDIISILPLFTNAKGLYSKGLKYKLENSDIEFGRAIGISNVLIDEICEIKITEGEAAIIKQN